MQYLSKPRPAWVTFAVGLVAGWAYVVYLVGFGTAFGTGDFWRLPRGVAGGHVDIKTAMSGYFWFVQDSWRWPLFHIANANGDNGANAVLVDPVPLLALVAKMVRSATGATLNLFPLWVSATFALNAAALALLVRALGQRSLLAAMLAGCIGALAPVVHNRFGHLGHAAHWVFVFALAAYAASVAGPRRRAVRAGWSAPPPPFRCGRCCDGRRSRQVKSHPALERCSGNV